MALLMEVVAEYSEYLRYGSVHTDLRDYSPSRWKSTGLTDGYFMQQEANQLCQDKGAILALSDPIGLVEDLSGLIQYLDNHFH